MLKNICSFVVVSCIGGAIGLAVGTVIRKLCVKKVAEEFETTPEFVEFADHIKIEAE